MKRIFVLIIYPFQFFQLISLDVALGAVVSSVFIGDAWERKAGVLDLVLLFLAVWVIYLFDRLIDVYPLKEKASTERHRFFQRNFSALFVLVLVLVGAALTIVIQNDIKPLEEGFVLSAIMLGYFLANYFWKAFSRSGLKELLVAFIYTIGVHLPFLKNGLADAYSSTKAVTLILFFFLAIINLVMFSQVDREKDEKDGRESVASSIGEKTLMYFTGGVFLSYFVLVLIIWKDFPFLHSSVLLVQGLVLFLLWWKPFFFLKTGSFRILGDAVFLIPAIAIV